MKYSRRQLYTCIFVYFIAPACLSDQAALIRYVPEELSEPYEAAMILGQQFMSHHPASSVPCLYSQTYWPPRDKEVNKAIFLSFLGERGKGRAGWGLGRVPYPKRQNSSWILAAEGRYMSCTVRRWVRTQTRFCNSRKGWRVTALE